MIQQNLKEVEIDSLTVHPECHRQLYREKPVPELIEEIKRNGVTQTPLVNQNNQIIGGLRIIEALKELGATKIWVIVVDIPDEYVRAYRVFHNTVREKNYQEQFNEILVLREFWGKRQGQRPVLHPGQEEAEKIPHLDDRIQAITGISTAQQSNLLAVGDYPEQQNLLEYAGIGKDQVSLKALYNAIRRATDMQNDDEEDTNQEINLDPVCCPHCTNGTKRIFVGKDWKLYYASDIDKSNIKF